MIENSISLKKINKSLYRFFVSLLHEIPKISPLSSQEKFEYWLSAQSFVKIEQKMVDEKKEDEINISPFLSSDVLALDYFYRTDRFSYQPLPPQLSRIISEKKQEDMLTEIIKISHLSVEAVQILFLLVQHMQILSVVCSMHVFAQSSIAKNHLLFIADLLWYRSAFWCLVHSITICKYFFSFYKKYSHPSMMNIAIHAKIKSMFIRYCVNTSWPEAKENYLLLTCTADFFSKEINPIKRDYLSWFDDLHDYVSNSAEKSSLPLTRINQINHFLNVFQSKLYYEVAHYFASIIIKMGLLIFVMTAMIFPYDNSVQLNNFSILFPLIDFMKLQLCSWLLVPVLAGVLKMAVLQPVSNNYLRTHKNNFQQECLGFVQAIQKRYDQLCETNDDWLTSDDKTNKMNLLDDASATLDLKLKKPIHAGDMRQRLVQAPSFLQSILYHIACMACSVAGTVMMFLLMLVPKNHCKRLHGLQKSYLESLDSPRLSDSLFGIFAIKKEVKEFKATPNFKIRAPVF